MYCDRIDSRKGIDVAKSEKYKMYKMYNLYNK